MLNMLSKMLINGQKTTNSGTQLGSTIKNILDILLNHGPKYILNLQHQALFVLIFIPNNNIE